MALGKQLARVFDFEIYDGTDYVEIGGVNSFSPSREKNDTDVTDFDSEGWMEHLVASRGMSFDMEGFHIEDADTGDRDAGQEVLEEAALEMGPDALKTLRIVGPGGNTEIYMEVSIDAPFHGLSDGGGTDDSAGWSASLTMSGKPSDSDPNA